MARTVEEIMTRDPRTVEIGDSLVDAARAMREGDIGNVIVTDGGRVAGIVTDRDIVVRAIAEGREPGSTTAGGARLGSPTIQVLVPSSVIGPGFGATSSRR